MKTVCIYHTIDLDGWMSAAIVKHWFITNNEQYVIGDGEAIVDKNSLGISNNRIDFIGYNYGQPIPDLSEYDKVIMVDISFPSETMDNIREALIQKTKTHESFVWIDHHIFAINSLEEFRTATGTTLPAGLRDTKYAACELTWKFYFPNETMPEIVRLLGRYDCFGHKGTDEEQKVLEFQYGARQIISNYEEAYKYLNKSLNYDVIGDSLSVSGSPEDIILENGKAIYQYLCTEAKQAYKNGFEIKFNLGKETNSKYHLCNKCTKTYPNCLASELKFGDGIGNDNIISCDSFIPKNKYKFIAINKERFNPINFGIDYHKYKELNIGDSFTTNFDNNTYIVHSIGSYKDGISKAYYTTESNGKEFIASHDIKECKEYDGAACFHYDGGAKLWRFSLYNDNGNVDCSVIAKQYGGGGHAGAAGFVLTNEDFLKLINK